MLASSEVLAHYDPKLPLKLDCDASAYGVGGVLSHTHADGTELMPLGNQEKKYAQIEKEGLALIFIK